MKVHILFRAQQIKEGDKVLSVNIATMMIEEDIALKVVSPVHDDIIELSFADGTLNKNTFDHPYYVKDKGWCSYAPEKTKLNYNIDAQQLMIGDTCYQYKSGKLVLLQLKYMQENIKAIKTYNIMNLKKNNSYFANGILVSNETTEPNFTKK